MPHIPPRIRACEEMATVVAGFRVAARLEADPNHEEAGFVSRAHYDIGDEIPPLRHGHPLLQQEYDRVYTEYTDRELVAEYRLRMAWEIGNGPNLQQRMRGLLDELYHGVPNPSMIVMQQWVRERGLVDTSDMEVINQVRIAQEALEATLQDLPRIKLQQGMLQTEGETECSICMSAVAFGEEVMQLSCRHWFHPECIIEWLKVCQTCPFCRGAVELPAS